MTMVVENIKLDGVCKHFRELFNEAAPRPFFIPSCINLAAAPAEALHLPRHVFNLVMAPVSSRELIAVVRVLSRASSTTAQV